MKLNVMALILFCLGTETLYAANGDRFVDGKFWVGPSAVENKTRVKGVVNSDGDHGVDTTNSAEKAEISEKRGVDGTPEIDAEKKKRDDN